MGWGTKAFFELQRVVGKTVSYNWWISVSLLIIGVTCVAVGVRAADSDVPLLSGYTQLLSTGKTEAAKELLEKIRDNSKNQELQKVAQWILLRDEINLQGPTPERIASLEKLAKGDFLLRPYVFLDLGVAYEKSQKYKDAIESFRSAIRAKLPRFLKDDAEYGVSRSKLITEKSRASLNDLRRMERRFRGRVEYADVLHTLVKAELLLKENSSACRWARKLYSKYSAFEKIANWGIDLEKNDIDAIRLSGCHPTRKEIQKRIRTLQMSGFSKKGDQELAVLENRSGEYSKYFLDHLRGSYLVDEGETLDAFKVLIPYYTEMRVNLNYLMLIAKAATRTGEYNLAISTYEKVMAISPRGKIGRSAQFLAAFLRFQAADYDGATSAFKEIIQKFPRSGYVSDSRWYLAFSSYMKRDYESALKEFRDLKRGARGRKRRAIETRLLYWIATVQLKLKQVDQAKDGFRHLAQSREIDYYRILAEARLAEIDGSVQRNISVANEKPAPSFLPVAAPLIPAERRTAANDTDTKANFVAVVDESEEGEDEAFEIADELAATDVEEDEKVAEPTPELDESQTVEAAVPVVLPTAMDFFLDAPVIELFKKDPNSERITRARALHAVGLDRWARHELMEVERSTRDPKKLRALIDEYILIGGYDRAHQIAQSRFGDERIKKGWQHGTSLWKQSYPYAYTETVNLEAQKQQIEPEFILSIMRAESQYRPWVRSPVGAVGLMQIMPYTALKLTALMGIDSFELNWLDDPKWNIRLGASYLKRLCDRWKCKLPLVAASYNAGPHRVHLWLKSHGHLSLDEFVEHIPFIETRTYVKRVVQNYYAYVGLHRFGGKPPVMASLVEPIGIFPDGPVSAKETW